MEVKPGETHEPPPVFKSWTQLYVMLLCIHAVIIIVFYLITLIFNQA